MKKIFFFFAGFFLVYLSHAQHRCGSTAYMNYLYQRYPELRSQQDSLNLLVKQKLKTLKQFKATKTAAEEVYQIPVVVHVIYNNYSNGVTNISDEQIYSQIAVLNQDYSRTNTDTNLTYNIYKSVAANVNIQFCLATIDPEGAPTTGIVRVYNSKSSFDLFDNQALKSLSYWPSDQYLNLWVCNLVSPYLGYAQFPNYTSLPGLSPTDGPATTDGVVIDYTCFGSVGAVSSPYNMGRTATHEVGHWLGLLHIWGDNFCGDDYISDTPPQSDAHQTLDCDTSYSSCAGPTTIDMIQNYMDYSVDACMNLFTTGQKDRMRTVMTVSPARLALFESSGCCPQEYTVQLPHEVTFEDNSYLNDQWQIINFDASSMYSKKWEEVSPGAYGESNTSLMIDNDSVYSALDTTYWDVLQSPIIDLSSAERPMLDFDLAYAGNTTSSATDSLVIYYNLGCKDNWVPFKTLYGEELITTSRKADNFVPEVSEWEKTGVSLEFLKGKKRVRFRIVVYSKGINRLYIDNLNFYKESNKFTINAFPVPVMSELTIEAIYTGYRDVSFEMINMLGKTFLKMEKKDSTSFVETINIENIPAGVYDIRVISGTITRDKRIVVY